MSYCGFAHDDGAYVLGALSAEDRSAFERHLTDCPSCARSVRELAGLPGLLARVPVDILDPDELPTPVPDTLLPSLVRRAHRSRRRRARVTAGLVAAAAVLAIGAVGVATRGDDGTPPPSAAPTAAPVLMTPVGSSPVSGWLSLTQVGWGTRLDLECSYSEEDGHTYRDDGAPMYAMFVTRTDGRTEQVASWKGLPGRTMHLSAATAADAADVASVVVRDSSGAVVLELDS